MKIKIITAALLCLLFSAAAKADNIKARPAGAADKTGIAKTDSLKTSLFLDAIRHYTVHEDKKSEAALKQLLQIDSTNDAAYYYLAHLALRSQDVTSGEYYLKKSIALDSSNFWYKDMLGQIYIKTGKVKEALSTYELLLKEFPKRTSIYYTLTNIYIATKETGKAREMLDKIEESFGKSEPIALTNFNIYRLEQNWEGALKYLVDFDREFQSPKIECLIGDMYSERYQDSLALVYYGKALSLDRRYAPAMYGRAEVYRTKGEYEAYFADMLPFMGNGDIDIQMKAEYLKQIFQNTNLPVRFRPQMDSIMRNIEQAHAQDSTANAFLAVYYAQGGDQSKCKELLQKNIQLYPDNYSMRLQAILALMEFKEWKAMGAQVDTALRQHPHDTDLLQLKGLAQFNGKDLQGAVQTYRMLEKSAAAANDTSLLFTAYNLLGDLHYEMKAPKETYKYFKKALKIRPDDNGVLNNYAYYLALEGKSLKLAYEMSKKTVESEPDNTTFLDTFGWILYLMDKPVEAKAQFKHAMLYGGTESAAILDHYAEVLFRLKEYDLAFIYWDQAKAKDPTLEIDAKVKERKNQMKR